MTAATNVKPFNYTEGLGELIRSYRLYLGMSQRSMADLLCKDRRDYQRIETGRDACPPGLLSTVEALTDQFDSQVEALIDKAIKSGGIKIDVRSDVVSEWERIVAGRAAAVACGEPNLPSITLAAKEG